MLLIASPLDPQTPPVTMDQRVALDNAHKEAIIARRSFIHGDVIRRDVAVRDPSHALPHGLPPHEPLAESIEGLPR